jgi:flagellar hook-associated protein 1 FlgK
MSFRVLYITRSALLAQQAALDITSGNIANVNTPGYTRRRPVLVPIVPQPGAQGTGVLLLRIQEFRARYLEQQLRNTTARHAAAESDERVLQRITAILGEPATGDTGVAALLEKFLDALRDAAYNPADLSRRQLLLQRAEAFAQALNRIGQDLEQLRQELLGQALQQLDALNPLLQRLAELNIRRASSPEGSETAIALADEQARLLDTLARQLPITTTQDERGMITVSLAGHVLVSGGSALRLELRQQLDDASGERSAQVWLIAESGTPIASVPLEQGELGSLLYHYNVTLDGQERTTGFSLVRELNGWVAELVERINAVLAQGYGLEDTGPTPPGRALFQGTTLQTVRLAADVAADARALPLSAAPGQPDDGTIAWRLLDELQQPVLSGGRTARGAYSAIVTQLGTLQAQVQERRQWLQMSQQQLEAQRQALEGVNLDEEALNLIRYQKAFEAAARVASVAASLLDTLIRMGS